MADDKKNPLGEVGHQVRANLASRRDAAGLSYQRLSERLNELGRAIPPLGLSRIEKGDRRVDADDLVALAVALGVNPTRLLLPVDDLKKPLALTPATVVPAGEAWLWANGTQPLYGSAFEDDWERNTLPPELRLHEAVPAKRAARTVVQRVEQVLETDDPEARKARAAGLRRALAILIAEVEDLLGDADG